MISSTQLLLNANTATPAENPNPQVSAAPSVSVIKTYRHNPYGFSPLKTEYTHVVAAAAAPAAASSDAPAAAPPAMSSAGFALPVPASVQRAKEAAAAAAVAAMETSGNDDGVSEASSDCGEQRSPRQLTSATTSTLSPETTAAVAPRASIRYASVNFRFGSAWFIAPFRTQPGDMVVVDYPANNSLHMGLVSAITTAKPPTFYSEDNTDPNHLTAEEAASLPRLLRHARDFDKQSKMDLRAHDLRSLQNAQMLAAELNVPVTFLDAEWLLDLSAVTFLVNVYGDVKRVDSLADELAAQEGAEVVFTYPAVGQSF